MYVCVGGYVFHRGFGFGLFPMAKLRCGILKGWDGKFFFFESDVLLGFQRCYLQMGWYCKRKVLTAGMMGVKSRFFGCVG